MMILVFAAGDFIKYGENGSKMYKGKWQGYIAEICYGLLEH